MATQYFISLHYPQLPHATPYFDIDDMTTHQYGYQMKHSVEFRLVFPAADEYIEILNKKHLFIWLLFCIYQEL